MVRTGCLAGLLLLAACSDDDPLIASVRGSGGAGPGDEKEVPSSSAGGASPGIGALQGSGGRSSGSGATSSSGGRPSSGGAPTGKGGAPFGAAGVPLGPARDPIDSGLDGCGAAAFAQPPTPIDVLLVVDHSSSMGDPIEATPPTTRWSVVQAMVTAFVRRPETTAAGTGVGIQYFPLRGIAPESCQADYTSPAVEIGLLPGNADSIAASIAQQTPAGFAPTAAALSGAIAHMKKWASAHPGRVPAIVLVTDGFPTECDPQDVAGVAQIAKQAFDMEPRVRTFVVGLNLGPGGSALKDLSVAGGSVEPTLIDGGDIVNQFLAAMLRITPTPLACSIDLPKVPGVKSLDLNKVNLQVRSNAAMLPETIPMVPTSTECTLNGGNGWYFSPTTNPKTIELCPALCARLPAVRVEVLVGCALPIIPPL